MSFLRTFFAWRTSKNTSKTARNTRETTRAVREQTAEMRRQAAADAQRRHDEVTRGLYVKDPVTGERRLKEPLPGAAERAAKWAAMREDA